MSKDNWYEYDDLGKTKKSKFKKKFDKKRGKKRYPKKQSDYRRQANNRGRQRRGRDV